MKKLLLKFAIFISPILLLAYPLDLFLSKKLRTSGKEEYSVWSDIYDGKIDAEIAIYGSSRAWVHISPQILEDILNKKAYNFGINGHHFWLQYFRQKEFLKYNEKPKIIIYSLDNHTLRKAKELYNKEQFLPYMLWDHDIRRYTSVYKGFTWTDYYIPFIRYIGNFEETWLSSTLLSERIKGYKGQESEWDEKAERIRLNVGWYESTMDPELYQLFDDFLQDCKSQDIQVVFVFTPMHGPNFVTNKDEIMAAYKQLAEKHGLVFFDYSEDPAFREQQYFYNYLHLNKKGAELLTGKLARELKKILEKQTAPSQ